MATAPTSAGCEAAMCTLMPDSAVDTVSDTSSRNPSVRMNPNERNRVRHQPRTPCGVMAALFQICSSAASIAANTVVALMSNVTTLTRVAIRP